MADEMPNRTSPNADQTGRDELRGRLDRLGRKLDERKSKAQELELSAATGGANNSQLAKGLKVSSEFIAAILVGVGLGWATDHWLGTSPWGLIVFLMLGFCAGIMNVLRSAGQVAEFGAPPEKSIADREQEAGTPDGADGDRQNGK